MSDLIRREDLIYALNNDCSIGHYGEFEDGSEVGYTDREIRRMINAVPSIDAVEVRHGEWIMNDIQRADDTDNGNYQYTCSVCGHGDIHAMTQEVPYCWWCGSRMKGADDE